MNRTLRIYAALLALCCVLTLCACGREREGEPFVDPTPAVAPAEGEEPDGTRFKGVVMLEGQEEPVKLEHIISSHAGVSLDYDYESFIRTYDDDSEYFQWASDNESESPEIYLQITASPASDYAMTEHLNECVKSLGETPENSEGDVGRFSACDMITSRELPERNDGEEFITVRYVIPAPDGCRVAKLRYTQETAETICRRMEQILSSLEVREIDWEAR